MNEIIGNTEQRLLIDLILSVIAGFIIGAERERRGKDAGISTYTMVIVGSMMFTFLSSLVDPNSESRIAAQIVSGVGFLGAGLILKEGTNVKNLTTAASIWASASVGMAFGFDYHVIGLLVTAAIAFVPRIPHVDTLTPDVLQDKKIKSKKHTSKSR